MIYFYQIFIKYVSMSRDHAYNFFWVKDQITESHGKEISQNLKLP